MSAKRKLVYNGRHGLPEGTRCFWCGSSDASPEFIRNPGGSPLLACCSQVEYEKAKAYHEIAEALFDLRKPIDKLEELVDNNTWPLPKYRELLFIS